MKPDPSVPHAIASGGGPALRNSAVLVRCDEPVLDRGFSRIYGVAVEHVTPAQMWIGVEDDADPGARLRTV
jgi:hypothetical protein